MNIRKRLAQIGFTPGESDELRLRRTIVLTFAWAMSLAGVLWGTFVFFFYQNQLALLPPFAYGAISLLNVAVFARTRNFPRFRFIQLSISLLLPFFMMIFLGGLVQGSATILWSLIAPLAALLVAERRRATFWFFAFLVLVVVSLFLEPVVSSRGTADPQVRTILFAMNIIGPWTAAFVLLRHFLQEKDVTLAENVRLVREMRRQTTEMTLLAEIGNDILATLDLGVLLGRITAHARELLSANNCAIYLLRPEAQKLSLIACAGSIPDEVKAFEPRLGQGIIGYVAQTGEAEIVSDTSTDPRRVTLPNVSASSRAEKLMVAPLFSRQEVIGVMSIWRPAGEAPFDAADLHVLERLSRQASIAINNARLYEETAAARAAAVSANEAKSAFLATMSHEIRTPMNAVIGMTSLLLATEQTAEQREFTETIRRSGEMLLLLINDILDFSKIEAGQLELEERPFDLRDAVETALELIAMPAEDKGLRLSYTISPGTPPTLVGDVTRLRQILINLLSNAIKFTETGEVAVAVDAVPPATPDEPFEVHFAVRDTGIGIPQDRMDRLFRSFSQVDASTTRTYGGTGLGLAICKRLCQLMGGDIAVTSEVGQGSTFAFTIRAAAGLALVEPVSSPEQPRRDSEFDSTMGQRLPLRILLADDNSTNQKLGVRLLQQLGYRADVAGNGLEVVTAVQRQPYDVVLMDVQMPVIDGLEAARQIRQMPLRQPYLIATTADVLMDKRSTCEAAGMNDFLSKPIRVPALMAALARAAGSAEPPAPTEAEAAPLQADDGPTAVDPAALDRLQAIMGGELRYLHELIHSFLEEAPQLITQMQQGVAAQDATAVRLAAHSLKSNVADFGAREVHKLTRQIETLARDGALAEVPELVTAVAAAYLPVERALRALVDGAVEAVTRSDHE
ncbi:MAG: response regulator [Anaerolineaceae bacterium]|nr:response regulator [Anaerolineaceae bacterium]